MKPFVLRRRRTTTLTFTLAALAAAALTVAQPGTALAQRTPPDLPTEDLPDVERRELEAVFVGTETLLGVTAYVPHPAADAQARATALAAARPQSAVAAAALAEAAFRAGDFAAAEAAWKDAAVRAGAATWPRWRLARFYAARSRPGDELVVLADLETFAPAEEREAVHARVLGIFAEEGFVRPAEARRHRRALVDLHADDPSWLERWVDELVAARDATTARAEVARFAKAHPDAARTTTRLLSRLDLLAGKPDDAVARWRTLLAAAPLAADVEGRYADYYELLGRLGRLDAERARLAASTGSGPRRLGDLVPLFYLHVVDGEPEAARALLAATRPDTASDADALLAARLAARLGDRATAVALYHGLAAAAKTETLRETAHVELATLFLADDLGRTGLTPLDPLAALAPGRTGIDPGVSLPGGLLSLALEGQRFADLPGGLTRVSAAWGNGVRAQRLLDHALSTWPKSRRVQRLALAVLGHHRAWGQGDAVVALADTIIATWPRSDEAAAAALAAAHALRPRDRAGSDKLFRRAIAVAEAVSPAAGAAATKEFVRVLVADKRWADAVAVLWERVQRHPGDPVAYERLAQLVTETKLFDQELSVYEQAMKRFGGPTWGARLARYKLRHQGETEFRRFLLELIARVPGSEVEAYLGELVAWDFPSDRADRVRLYEAFHKAALDRFPLRTSLVHRLLLVYDAPKTGDPAARRALLVRYAALDPELRTRLVVDLAREDRAEVVAAELKDAPGAGARLLRADLLVFRSRHDEARPEVLALRPLWPADVELARRAATLELGRGTAPEDLAAARAAAVHWDALAAFYPEADEYHDAAASALAEAGDLDGARLRWARLIAARPGDPAAHLEVAAAAWDYYLFAEAATELTRARQLGGDPLLYWDRLGGVYESDRRFAEAAREYARAWADEVDAELRARETSGVPTGLWSGGGYDEDEGGYDDEGDLGAEGTRAYRHGAEATPGEKLAALSARPKGKALVAAAFTAEQKARPRAGRTAYAWARWQDRADDAAGAHKTRLAMIGGAVAGPALLARLADDARDAGDHELAVRARARRADLLGRDPEAVEALAEAQEAAGRHADAEAARREALATRDAAPAGAPTRAGAADAWLAFAGWLDRRGREDEAMTARREAAGRRAGAARDEALLAIAWAELRRGKVSEALAGFVDQARRHPEDLRALDGQGTIAVRLDNDKQLDSLYAAAMRKLAQLPGSQGARLVAEARRQYVQKLEQRGRLVDAAEQWIALVNDSPDDLVLVAEAVGWARQKGQLGRLEAFYTRTVAASPKDVRWPLVLATLHEQSGKPAAAAAAYAQALTVRPDRVDLHERRALSLEAAGEHAAAAAVWARVYALSDADPRPLYAQARAWIRAGQAAKGQTVLEAWLAAEVHRGPYRFAEAAAIYAPLGQPGPAFALRRRGLAEATGAPEEYGADRALVEPLVDDAVRAGQSALLLVDLARARKALDAVAAASPTGAPAAWSRLLDEAVADHLFAVVVTEGLDEDARALLPACVAAARRLGPGAIGQLAERADAAGLTDWALALWDERATLAKEAWERERYAYLGLERLADRGADRALLARFDGDRDLQRATFYPLAIAAAHRLGDVQRELAYLHAWWPLVAHDAEGQGFAFRSPLVARYLDLLAAGPGKDEARLRAAALRGTVAAGQVVDWLFAHGRADLGLEAISAAAGTQGLPARWVSASSGLALAELYPTDPRVHAHLATALGHGTIDAHLGVAGRAGGTDQRYREGAWVKLAMRYAGLVARAPRKGVSLSDWALADAEARPRAAGAQLTAGQLFLAAKDARRAEEHFRAALVLAPRSMDALDGVARARLAVGDRAGAFAAWDAIRTLGGDGAATFHAAALDRAGFRAEARAALADHLTQRQAKLDEASGPALFTAYAALFAPAERGTGGALDVALGRFAGPGVGDEPPWLVSTVLGLSFSATWGWGEPDAPDYRPGGERGYSDALLDEAALGPWLGRALKHAEGHGPERARAHAERTLVAYHLTRGDDTRGLGLIAEVRRRHAAAGPGATLPRWVPLVEAGVLVRRGDQAGARTLLVAWLGQGFAAADLALAVDTVAAAGDPRLGAELFVTAHAELRRGEPQDRATHLGLASAHLVLGKPEAARAVLDAGLAEHPDDADLAQGGAERFAAAKRPADALAYRLVALRLRPRDPDVRLALARDTAAVGRGAEAAELVVPILGDRTATRAQRAAAGELLLGFATADRAVARHAANAALLRAKATPFDAVTWVTVAGLDAAAGAPGGGTPALDRALAEALFAGPAYAALGERHLAAGRAAEAALAFESAVAATPPAHARALRLRLFAAHRAAGAHHAALAAIEAGDDGLQAYRQAGLGGGRAAPDDDGGDDGDDGDDGDADAAQDNDRYLRARRAAAVTRGRAALPGDARAVTSFATAAADSATRAGDFHAAAYYLAVAGRATDEGVALGRARAARRADDRRFVSDREVF